MHERIRKLADVGQSVWVDYLSRDFLEGGGLGRRVEQGVSGVTSNPTIFKEAITSSDCYDGRIAELAGEGFSPEEIFGDLARADVRDACDVLAGVYERTQGRDGFVSLEVSPDLAYDVLGTVAEATRLHEEVDRPNLLVKIPATKPGLTAIEEMVAAGRSINVTLIFSLQRYRAVMEAYIRGLHRLSAAGGDVSAVYGVASFFVSRVDTEADRRLEEIGGYDHLKGRLAVENARLAYEAFLHTFAGESWEFLESKGAKKQRPLWASTSTKNPEYPDVKYVEELTGPDTINTMPPETLDAFLDHGEVRGNALEEDLEGGRQFFEQLREAGVDYYDVARTLEREGVQKFADSYHELLEAIEQEKTRLARA